ncbi:hypothetical protein A0J61_04652 [Choanephora cucurbitarum]|uniref:Uncharacterized protein n=1 Tax=Choanephora cucurbitarum TaxID=101091 RepID=A0A1C7NDY2_9FUNG|nr:hypothetical protein A0J61_04652 [Choanephora cucurbitarum]
MWKRERMMVDVVSVAHQSSHPPPLQNRTNYPLGDIQDTIDNFYAGHEFSALGELINPKKRPLSLENTITITTIKKQKVPNQPSNPPTVILIHQQDP